MTVLVTGGAGYIGSHFVRKLSTDSEVKIIVVDNFSQGRNNIIKRSNVKYEEVDLLDKEKLINVFKKNKVDIVAHFAALANVPDSIARPTEYYKNNIVGGLNLLDCMLENGVKNIIFSSSASIYGEPVSELISENHQKRPINPYGYTKLVFEEILKHYHTAYGINSVSFRYFCAAGCDESGEIRENHSPETHVIPMILETIFGKRKEFFVYGNDFPTPDGTGIRDYIHVNDLAEAHSLAVKKLSAGKLICDAYNLGINRGYSVMELIAAAKKVSGKEINFQIKPRRPGDPSTLVADASAARAELGWAPKYNDIESIVRSTFLAYKKIV